MFRGPGSPDFQEFRACPGERQNTKRPSGSCTLLKKRGRPQPKGDRRFVFVLLRNSRNHPPVGRGHGHLPRVEASWDRLGWGLGS
jgi:hypothetical protein